MARKSTGVKHLVAKDRGVGTMRARKTMTVFAWIVGVLAALLIV